MRYDKERCLSNYGSIHIHSNRIRAGGKRRGDVQVGDGGCAPTSGTHCNRCSTESDGACSLGLPKAGACNGENLPRRTKLALGLLIDRKEVEVPLFTVSGTATLVPALFPSPLYTAEIVWNPEDHDTLLILYTATPLLFTGAVLIAEPSSWKVTVPVGFTPR